MFLDPDPAGAVSLEFAVLGLADLSGAPDPTHGVVAESYANLRLGGAVRLSLGYEADATVQGAPAHRRVRHAGWLRGTVTSR